MPDGYLSAKPGPGVRGREMGGLCTGPILIYMRHVRGRLRVQKEPSALGDCWEARAGGGLARACVGRTWTWGKSRDSGRNPGHAGPDQEIPGSPNRDPDSRFPTDQETARFPIPDSRFPIPGRSGIGNREFPPKTGKTGDPTPDSRVTSRSEHQLQ
jgi:hypothetical protein